MSRKLPQIEAEYEKRLKESDRKWSARVDLQKRCTETVQKELNTLMKRLNAVIRIGMKHRVKRCAKCKAALDGKPRTFRGEPCFWHVNCGINEIELCLSDLCEKILEAATGKRGAALVRDLEIVESEGKKA